MSKPSSDAPPAASKHQQELIRSINKLQKTIETLPEEYGYAFSPAKNLLFSYLKGIVIALGSLTALAVVVPLIVWMLHGIQWVPLVGDFVANIATRVEQVRDR